MRIRVLLMALAAFTAVNGAITLYLVRTMYRADRQPHVLYTDGEHEEALETAPRDMQSPLADMQASQHSLQPTAMRRPGPRRWRLRCKSYKNNAPRRYGRGHGECYGDRGTQYVQKALAGYFEMTEGDDWDLLWTLVPQARYDLARHRPELFCADCDLSPRSMRLWCDDQVDSIMFFAGAGDKCRLAQHLAAVNDVYPLRSFVSGTQLLRLPNDRAKIRETMVASGTTRWIFKPCAGGGGDGQGIFTLDDLSALPEVGAGVAQPYVMKPYLYQGVKFHLRLYVLVTSYKPLRVLLFKDGLLKRAGTKYEEVEDAILTEMQRAGGDAADEIRKAHWTNQHVNKDTPPLPLSNFFSAVDTDFGDHGLGATAREIWRQLRADLSKIFCARVNPDMPDIVTEPPWSDARYGNCFDILGVDVMFDHGDESDGSTLRPRLLEINVGPDLTAHDGWEDELSIHRRMMLEVAGLLGSRYVSKDKPHICLEPMPVESRAGDLPAHSSAASMEPIPELANIQREMKQHVSADHAAAISVDEAAELWQLMLEREHLRSFDRLIPPWQPVQQAGGSELDETERIKDEKLAQELSEVCLGSTLSEQSDDSQKLDGTEAKLWRTAELLRMPTAE